MNLTTSNIMAIRRFDQKIQLLSRQKKGIKRGLVQLQLVEMLQKWWKLDNVQKYIPDNGLVRKSAHEMR